MFTLKSAEQVSLKKRNFFFFKKPTLVFGTSGLAINSVFKFFFYHIILFKQLLKIFYQYKYTSFPLKKYWYALSANYPCRKKSKNCRMGKGVGVFFSWAILMPANFVFLQFIYFSNKKTTTFLKMCKKRINPLVFLINSK